MKMEAENKLQNPNLGLCFSVPDITAVKYDEKNTGYRPLMLDKSAEAEEWTSTEKTFPIPTTEIVIKSANRIGTLTLFVVLALGVGFSVFAGFKLLQELDKYRKCSWTTDTHHKFDIQFPVMASETSTTFRVCDKKPEKHWFYDHADKTTPQQQVAELSPYTGNKCTEILQMSNFSSKTAFSNNGFVDTVVDAYNKHYNLIIRPDDVWAAIMTQFSFYINKHAEEFRGKFVNFEGKKELEVRVGGSLRNVPYDTLVKLMSKEIDKNLIDPEVKKWILPNFSTTTDNDLVTIGVVFMASMKKYFDYKFGIMCGIPSVTLEGTTDDWKNVHGRLEKLKEYKLGKWYDMLEPVLQQFVNSKEGKVDLDFWQRIVHYERGGSGPSFLSGWITVFCVFDKDGNWRESNLQPTMWGNELDKKLMQWPRIDTDDIPTGIVEVDVKIDDNGVEYSSIMFAGHMGAEIKNNGDTVQPTLGWAIALKPEGASKGAEIENDLFR